tara:strand:+ start:2270 stop:5224 length:2955 start_codon:yes stop_codon:yes gene_type:complete
MSEQIRAVTLKRGEDLEKFYSDMKSDGYRLSMKRPMSRATHYFLTDNQAATVKADSRVLNVELLPGPNDAKLLGWVENNTVPHTKAGVFRKNTDYDSGTGWEYDWGKLHCAGTTAQKRIRPSGQQPLGGGETGFWHGGAQADEVTDDISIFGDGRHVDVVICDAPVGYDAQEWTCDWETWDTDGTPRPPGQSRFHQYDWYGQLNQYVTSIDDDNTTPMTPPYNDYGPMSSASSWSSGHGMHVCGTVTGKFYGWAPAANIYHIHFQGNMSSWLMFDYIRAFHRHKPINSITGRRNPTITNHSWSYIYNFAGDVDNSLDTTDIGSVTWRGTVYSQSNNPNPSGWTKEGLWADFGIDPYLGHPNNKPSRRWSYIDADIEDQIEDGVVHVGAAGNEHMMQVPEFDPETGTNHVDYDNRMYVNNYGTVYLCRGGTPNGIDAFTRATPNGAGRGISPVNVGCLGKYTDNRYASFTNYGPKISVFAPGNNTLSAYHLYYTDPKYGGLNFYTDMSGTSMASPQVCGIAACLASGGQRFTTTDLIGYIQQHGIKDEMVFDVDPRGRETYEPYTTDTLANQTTNWKISVTDATGTNYSSADDPAITIKLGDKIQFTHWGSQYWSNGVNNYSTGTITLAYISKDKHFTGVYGQQSGTNPTVEYEVGDKIEWNNYHSSNRTIYIKTAASTGTGDLVPSGEVLGTNGGTWCQWTPTTPGTYYYCDSADASARGTINIYPAGHFYSHPLYIKTNQSTGTGNQVSNPAAIGQGRKRYEEGTISWVPTALGTYYYCHETNANMSGEIIVVANTGKIGQTGNMADESCQQGSLNLTMNAVSPRKLQVLQDGWNKKSLKGHRRHDEAKVRALQMFPRTNSFYRPIVGSNTYIIDVTNSGSGSYVFNGYDRADHFENKTNAVINVKKGDIIQFVMNASGHPFWISTSQGTGQPSAGNIPANITNNGSATGQTITWNTAASPTGTTYYNCEYHGSMTGMIFVNA